MTSEMATWARNSLDSHNNQGMNMSGVGTQGDTATIFLSTVPGNSSLIQFDIHKCTDVFIQSAYYCCLILTTIGMSTNLSKTHYQIL
jgi:hypothetical protein